MGRTKFYVSRTANSKRKAAEVTPQTVNPRSYLQTPHFPPSLAQCLQYLQFLQAWQGSAPVQVAAKMSGGIWLMRRIDNRSCARATRSLDFSIVCVLRGQIGHRVCAQHVMILHVRQAPSRLRCGTVILDTLLLL